MQPGQSTELPASALVADGGELSRGCPVAVELTCGQVLITYDLGAVNMLLW
jgi:hypothetical protein